MCPRKATSKRVRTAFTSSRGRSTSIPRETSWVEIPPLIIDLCMEVGGGETCLKGHLSPTVKQTGRPALRRWLGCLQVTVHTPGERWKMGFWRGHKSVPRNRQL